MAKTKLFPALFSLLLHGAATLLPPRVPAVTVHRCMPPAARLAGDGVTMVVDVEGALLRSSSSSRSLFPYFMLVAVEAGSFLRGLLLLLLYPVISLLAGAGGGDVAVRAMAAVAFCGLRESRFRAGRAVLPRWLLDDVGKEAVDAIITLITRRRSSPPATAVWASSMPRVMVEPFLREYMAAPPAADPAAGGGVVVVAAREMKVVWGFYTGVMEDGGEVAAAASPEVRRAMEGVDGVIGFSGGSMGLLRSPLVSFCKEVYVVSHEEKSKWQPLPRRREYPRPLVFHDGRLAFLPTPLAAAAMLVWLPFGAALAAARLAVALALPYHHATLLLAATGQSWRLRGSPPPTPPRATAGGEPERRRGQLYVCNHRTLIDPVYVSIALDRPVRAVSYSLSRVSDLLSPIGATVRLARDRAHDGAAMARLLEAGAHVVVCPEGTTCREPYLLRFSPLFAELADGVVPVALAAEVAAFHGTTAGGWKSMDALCYLANPRMCYTVEFLPAVDASPVREGKAASTELANAVQRRVAEALGYESTMLTRKDKYLMLAGNDGVVRRRRDVAK
uniref:Phospholipid/glycerol acyltransferase domain-containing protein n=1 Tax=Oryza meridionalis TaxID=40149 RepID=A0A0E0FDA2_9ORYZ